MEGSENSAEPNGQTGSNLQNYTGMALLGLLFTIVGVSMLFIFIVSLTGIDIPEPLKINSPNYNYLLMGIVFIIAAIGLLKRIQKLWSITIIFMVIMIAGNALGLFFDGPMRIIVIVIFVAALIYILMHKARTWYGIE